MRYSSCIALYVEIKTFFLIKNWEEGLKCKIKSSSGAITHCKSENIMYFYYGINNKYIFISFLLKSVIINNTSK